MNTCPRCLEREKKAREAFERVWSLPPRIRQVFLGLAKSKTPQELAIEMGLSVKTIEYHRAELTKKLAIEGRDYAAMARLAMKADLVTCLVLFSVFALTCTAATLPIPKLSSLRPQRTATRLAIQSPKGISVFPLAGAITNPPRAVTLAWDYAFSDPAVDRFKSFCWTNMVGTNYQGYKETTWQGKVLTGRVSNLVAKATYWFTVQAGATNGLWSDPSNITTDHPTNLVVTFTYGGASMQWAASPLGPWKATNNVVNITNATAPRLFFRGVGITNRISVTTMTY